MSQIQPYRADSGLVRSRTSRALDRLAAQTDIGVARICAAGELEAAKLDTMQFLAGRAMQGVALLTQLEQQLATAVPLANSRLQAIGDIHALASAEEVASSPRRLS